MTKYLSSSPLKRWIWKRKWKFEWFDKKDNKNRGHDFNSFYTTARQKLALTEIYFDSYIYALYWLEEPWRGGVHEGMYANENASKGSFFRPLLYSVLTIIIK